VVGGRGGGGGVPGWRQMLQTEAFVPAQGADEIGRSIPGNVTPRSPGSRGDYARRQRACKLVR